MGDCLRRRQLQQNSPSLAEFTSRQLREQLNSTFCQRFFQMKELQTGPSQKNNRAGKNLHWAKTESHSCDWQAIGHGPAASVTHLVLLQRQSCQEVSGERQQSQAALPHQHCRWLEITSLPPQRSSFGWAKQPPSLTSQPTDEVFFTNKYRKLGFWWSQLGFLKWEHKYVY